MEFDDAAALTTRGVRGVLVLVAVEAAIFAFLLVAEVAALWWDTRVDERFLLWRYHLDGRLLDRVVACTLVRSAEVAFANRICSPSDHE